MALNISVNDLITNILPMLHASSTANLSFTTDAELTRLFDQAVKAHARRHGVFVVRDTASVTLVQGTAVYSGPARLIAIRHVALAGVPLVASSSSELEMLDDAYKTTQGTPVYWYADKEGQNKIGVYPVPDAAAAGLKLDLIIDQYPADLDTGHSNTAIPTPAPIGDFAEAAVVAEVYGKESDGQMPETAAALRGLAALYDQVLSELYGGAQ